MEKEYFEYWFEDEEEILELNGRFYYIVTGKNLQEIKRKAENANFRSTIEYSWGEEEGYWYKPGKIVSISKNCDGSWTAVFELES